MLNNYINKSKYLPQNPINFNSKEYKDNLLKTLNERNILRLNNKLPLLNIADEFNSIIVSNKQEQYEKIENKIIKELDKRRVYPPINSWVSALMKYSKQKKIANRYIKRFLKEEV